jgi:hypothetical protein
MYEQQTHQMHLEKTHPSGAEEWACSICGRRFLMQWPPAYSRTILEPGDEYATHSGSKSEMLNLGTLDVTEGAQTPDIDELFLPPALDIQESLDGSTDSPISSSFEATEDRATPLTDELRPWIKWLDKTDL